MRPSVLFIAVDDFATRIRGCGDPGAQSYAVAKIFVTFQKSWHSSLITVVHSAALQTALKLPAVITLASATGMITNDGDDRGVTAMISISDVKPVEGNDGTTIASVTGVG